MAKIVGRFKQARLDYQSRHGRRFTVEEIAQLVGVSRQAMSDIENGESLPRYGTLAKLCSLYGVGPGELLMYDEDWVPLRAAAA